MKISKKVSTPRHKKILIPTGVLLFLFAGFFGVLKFNDIFSSDSHNTLVNQSEKSSDDIDQKDSSNQDDYAHQNNAETIESTDELNALIDSGALSETGNNLWVVNKLRPLEPIDYQPDDLIFPDVPQRVPGNESMRIKSAPAKAIEQMFTEAKASGHSPMFSSGFRSYSYQVTLYNSYVRSEGRIEADKQSARPGYSEHQTGLAFDICNIGNCKLDQSFGSTPLGQWIALNAHKYGFIIRYPEDKQDVTGYLYEPWHLRFVGVDMAAKLYSSEKTMEEYFSLPPAPDYQ